jgi:PAS domain S-box-containing protein
MAFSTNSGDGAECARAENAPLSESEGLFRRMAKRAPVLIWMSDTARRCTWFNDAWLSYTGRGMEQELADNWRGGVHPDDLQRCLDVYTSAFDAREDYQLEYRLRRYDGRYGWIYDAGIPRFAEDNCFEGYIGYCWDITDRIRTANALQVSEQRFRAIFNSSFQFIGLLSPDGILLEANQTALDFAGLKEADVVGQPFWETPWWTFSPEVQDHLKASIQEAARGKLVRYEVEHIGAGGRTAFVDFSLKPVLNEQGETVLIIPEGRDITERKLAEEQEKRHKRELAHVMRLSTMGEMASGLAHELNQPLMAVASYCETALAELAKLQTPPRLNDILQRALDQSHRAADVIRHLREFVSEGSTPKQLVDIDLLIRKLIGLLDWEFRNGKAKITLELRGQGRTVMADKVQIEQVLINLLLNSLEAIQNGNSGEGQLVLQTRVLPDNGIEVTVSDNGPGIEAEMVERIFEPFQTNKKAGMGMGLSISRSIIEAHHGKLWVAEAPLGGASLAFSLPPGTV